FGRPQKRPVATEYQHQFAAFGGLRVGVDHVDLHAHRPHVIGGQVQRSPVDCLGGQDAEPNPLVAERLLYTTGRLGRFFATGVDDQQNGTFGRSHCGPLSTACRTAATSASPASGRSVWARSLRKYSTLPDGPGSGLAVTSTVCQPSSPARRATDETVSARRPGSCTTPP